MSDKEIDEIIEMVLEQNEDSLIIAISKIENLLNSIELSSEQKINVQFSLAEAYQFRGDHKSALDMLALIMSELENRDEPKLIAMIKFQAAISYCLLGYIKRSCTIFQQAIEELKQCGADAKIMALVSIEAGRAYHLDKNDNKARECWESSLKYFENEQEDSMHHARVKANLGYILLNDPDEKKQEEGVRKIEESSELKKRAGDLEGLANNYCNLGFYFFRKKRYERAITFTRLDLSISRKVGNLRCLASTLYNLSVIYNELKQLKPARQLIREALKIGETLKDFRLLEMAKNGMNKINETGRVAGLNNEKLVLKRFADVGVEKHMSNAVAKLILNLLIFRLYLAAFLKNLITL